MGTMYQQFGKRAMDTVLSFTALVTLSPLLLTTAAAIKLTSPGPVLFKQQRLGLHGKEFTIYKFRSMTVGAEHTGSGVYSGEGDPRVTAVGRFLRKTSIDELPQCVNVLKGDMALVGPRPPLTYHPWPLEQYTEEQLHMFSHDVTVPYNNRHLSDLMLMVPLADRIADRTHIDFTYELCPAIDATNISVKDAAHNNKRMWMDKIYYFITSIRPF